MHEVRAPFGEERGRLFENPVLKEIGADLFKIDTGNHYPRDYGKVFDVTNAEQRNNVKPKPVTRVNNMAQYNTVIICCPVWWYRMPLAVQSFLDEYNLSGKTIYLSVTHGGSRSAGIEREIAAAEPKAPAVQSPSGEYITAGTETRRGYTDPHAGGGSFAKDPVIIGWLFKAR